MTDGRRKNGLRKQKRAGGSRIAKGLLKKPRRILNRTRLQTKEHPQPAAPQRVRQGGGRFECRARSVVA